jgi:outer membrane protein
LIGASLFSLACSPATAAEPAPEQATVADARPASTNGFFLNVGPGALVFHAGATVRAGGTIVPGATVRIDANETLITEFGYRWNNAAISLTGGIPPSATVHGAGSLTPLGELGRIRYGPVVLAAQYHFTQFGRFQPYAGAGPVFLLIFRNEDGAVRNLDVRNHTGFAVELGAQYRLDSHWSLYFDAKKVSLKTSATGVLGGAPIQADIKLDPLVVTGGLVRERNSRSRRAPGGARSNRTMG